MNHCKARGWEGELLTLYDDGKRIWLYLYGVFDTNHDEAKAYLAAENLTKEVMEFEFEKKKREEEAKQKKENRKNKNKKGSSGKNKRAKTSNDVEGNNPLPIAEILITVPIQTDVTDKPSQEEQAHVGLHQASQDEDLVDYKPFVCADVRKHELIALTINEESKYCINGLRFDGVKCALCPKFFVNNLNDTIEEYFKPTVRKPMFCCRNAKEYCSYAVCFECRYGDGKEVTKLLVLVEEGATDNDGKEKTKLSVSVEEGATDDDGKDTTKLSVLIEEGETKN